MALVQLLPFLMLAFAHSISLAVSSQKERCMIVSSADETQLLKVDLKFAKFEGQAITEGYRVVLHDTETHAEQVFQVQHGTFRKEFPLTKNVVYRLCFKIVLSDYREVKSLFDYHVALKHQFNTAEQSIKVPEKLLRSKDLSQTYQYMDRTRELLQQVAKNAQSMSKQADQAFETQSESMSSLQWVSLIELVVIVGFGVYQYSKLKQLIQTRRVA